MKKSIYLAVIAVGIASFLLTSCESRMKKVENAEVNVKDAQKELVVAQTELNKEYPAFRIEAEAKIDANEKRIQELSATVIKNGDKLLNDLRIMRIEELKKKNTAMRNRLYKYEKEHSEWEVFKREFNHDLDGLVEAFKDLGKDNKN